MWAVPKNTNNLQILQIPIFKAMCVTGKPNVLLLPMHTNLAWKRFRLARRSKRCRRAAAFDTWKKQSSHEFHKWLHRGPLRVPIKERFCVLFMFEIFLDLFVYLKVF